MLQLLPEDRELRLDVHLRTPLKNHGPIVYLEGLLGGMITVENVSETVYLLNPDEIRPISRKEEKAYDEKVLYFMICLINWLIYVGENHPENGSRRHFIGQTASHLYELITGNAHPIQNTIITTHLIVYYNGI